MFYDAKVQEALAEIAKKNPHYISNFYSIEKHLFTEDNTVNKQEWLQIFGEQLSVVFYSDFYNYNAFHNTVLSYSYLDQAIWQRPIMLELFKFLNNILRYYVNDGAFKNIEINVRATAADNPIVITLDELFADISEWCNALGNANTNKALAVYAEDIPSMVPRTNEPKVSFSNAVMVHAEYNEDGNNYVESYYIKLAPSDKSAGLWWSLKKALRCQTYPTRRSKSTVAAENHNHDGVMHKLRSI